MASIPTYADFAARFPGLDASAHQSWVAERLSDAWGWYGDWRDRAEAALLSTAHRFVLDVQAGAGQAGGRIVASERTADLAVAFGGAGGSSDLTLTSYGRQLLQLQRLQPGRLPRVGGRCR